MNSAWVANESIDSYQKRKKTGILCKINFQKAYDNVSWELLDYTLMRMGFGPKWRKWIEAFTKFIHFSVLINGSSNGRFER